MSFGTMGTAIAPFAQAAANQLAPGSNITNPQSGLNLGGFMNNITDMVGQNVADVNPDGASPNAPTAPAATPNPTPGMGGKGGHWGAPTLQNNQDFMNMFNQAAAANGLPGGLPGLINNALGTAGLAINDAAKTSPAPGNYNKYAGSIYGSPAASYRPGRPGQSTSLPTQNPLIQRPAFQNRGRGGRVV